MADLNFSGLTPYEGPGASPADSEAGTGTTGLDFSGMTPYTGPVAAPTSSADVSQKAPDAAPTGPAPPQISPTLNAYANGLAEDIPVVGPMVNNAIDFVGSHIASAITGRPVDEELQRGRQRYEDSFKGNEVARTAGNITGMVGPLAGLGATNVGGKLLGMTGSLPRRMTMGAISGGALTGADSLARGDTPQQAEWNAVVGGGLGAGAPVLGKVAGAAWDALKGPSADRALATALKADQIDPTQANSLVSAMGPGATVADLGANSGQLAGALASLPGEPQSIIKNNMIARAAATGDRLANDVATNLGTGQPIGALTDSVVAGQKATAQPLYAAATALPVKMTPALNSLQNTPLGKQAFQTAATMMANDGKSGQGLTVGFLDYAKQALDDVASTNLRAGNNNAARQAIGMATTLRDEVDTQLGGAPGRGIYAQARDAFAGPAKVLDAIELGQSVFSKSTSPEQLQRQMAIMSTSERDGLLQGAQAAVQEIMGNAKNDAAGVQQAFRTNNSKDKLALLIGQTRAQAISDAIDREARFAGTKNTVMGNSLTAARTAMQKMVAPDTAALPKPQTWQGLTLSGLERARNALSGGYRNRQNIELAKKLSSGALAPGAVKGLGNASARKGLIAPATVPLISQSAGMLALPQVDPVSAAMGLARQRTQ